MHCTGLRKLEKSPLSRSSVTPKPECQNQSPWVPISLIGHKNPRKKKKGKNECSMKVSHLLTPIPTSRRWPNVQPIWSVYPRFTPITSRSAQWLSYDPDHPNPMFRPLVTTYAIVPTPPLIIQGGWTALHWASKLGKLATVQVLGHT